MQYLMAL